MCEIDGERATIFRFTPRKAAKEHACDSCDSLIAKGAVYFRYACLFEGRWSSEDMCAACHSAARDFGAAPGHMYSMPSEFPHMLGSCVDEGDADSTWVALLDQLRERQRAPRGPGVRR